MHSTIKKRQYYLTIRRFILSLLVHFCPILFFFKSISILKTQVNQEILHNTELINNVIYIIKRATNPL